MNRQKTTIFAYLGRERRCGGQAFFGMCLSTFNRMAASSFFSFAVVRQTTFYKKHQFCCMPYTLPD